jgi:phosphate acyltransferase
MGSDLGLPDVLNSVSFSPIAFADFNLFTFVMRQDRPRPLLVESRLANKPRVEIMHAPEVITMKDKPLMALKQKRDASTLHAIKLVNAGQASGAVRRGATGSLVATGILKLGTIKGVGRAALARVIPQVGGCFTSSDAGANPEAKPGYLIHTAIIDSQFGRIELGIERPRVALLTTGIEESKGNVLAAGSLKPLKRICALIKYVGPVEGFKAFKNEVDVEVCDGFVENISLGTWVSLSKVFHDYLKSLTMANSLDKVGRLFAKGAFNLRSFATKKARATYPLIQEHPIPLGTRPDVVRLHGLSTLLRGGRFRSTILSSTALLAYSLVDRRYAGLGEVCS